jgi:predicted DNA-binding WGR domain protein
MMKRTGSLIIQRHNAVGRGGSADYDIIAISDNTGNQHALITGWGKIGTIGQVKVRFFPSTASVLGEMGLELTKRRKSSGAYVISQLADMQWSPADSIDLTHYNRVVICPLLKSAQADNEELSQLLHRIRAWGGVEAYFEEDEPVAVDTKADERARRLEDARKSNPLWGLY